MDKSDIPIQFVKVSRETILNFIDSTKKQIIIAKPGYYIEEIEKIIDLIKKRKVNSTVFIDPDENSIRFGFGVKEALEIIQQNAETLNLQTAKHIRMSVIIVDDSALIYSPVALSWEAEPDDFKFPNGCIGGSLIAESLLKQFKASKEGNDLDKDQNPFSQDHVEEIEETNEIKTVPLNNVIFPEIFLIKKNAIEVKHEIQETIEKLEKNPPIDPSRLREITFYRNQYKIVRRTVKGVKIKNKTIDLRSFNIHFDKTDRLKSSWRVFTTEDLKDIPFIKEFENKIDEIKSKYTFDAGRHGSIIDLNKKNDLQTETEKEKVKFIKRLKGERTEEDKNTESKKIQPDTNSDQQQDKPEENLTSLLEKSREALKIYLFSICEIKDIKDLSGLFEANRFLSKIYKQMINKELTKKAALDSCIDFYITDFLRFPDIEEMYESVDIQFDYYDVSDELLNDVEFKKVLAEYKLKVRSYEKGYGLDKATPV